MLAFLNHLFSSANLAPHGICLLWRPELIWLHVISDSLTAMAYFSIPIALTVYVVRRPDVEFGWVFCAFAIFIMACGTTHLFGVWTLWFPDYAAEGVAKAVTAIASIITAIAVWPLLPRALALPSEQELRGANIALQDQIRRRSEIDQALKREREQRAEAEQAMADEKFRLAIEGSPNGVVVVDSDGNIVQVNGIATRMFGYEPDELIGHAIDILIPAAVRSAHPVLLRDFITHSSRRAMGVGRDLAGVRKDGSEFPVEIGLNPIRTPAGVMVLSAIVDVSERKAAQQELERQAEELRRSNEELEQFAYVAAHDLQEPLRMVASFTELLRQRYTGRLDEKADSYIAYAADGAKRMQHLINDLLIYSRVGRQALAPKAVSAGAVVRRVIGDMQERIDNAGAIVTCADLPTLWIDEMQLEHLMQNLVSNALKFHSDAPPNIEIYAEHLDDKWILSVRDNGIGIEPQYADRIFLMFQKLNERTQYEGDGMGLAIAKKIVERHSGKIWFVSEPGRGTTFSFSLPDAR